MKHARAQFHHEEERSHMRFIQIILAVVLIVVGFVVVASLPGCSADWNKPHPNVVTPADPCGSEFHSCGNGMCCRLHYACRPGYCGGWTGLEPTTWGSTRDGGAEERMPLVTEEEARQRQQKGN
jgi:hypothetical protein